MDLNTCPARGSDEAKFIRPSRRPSPRSASWLLPVRDRSEFDTLADPRWRFGSSSLIMNHHITPVTAVTCVAWEWSDSRSIGGTAGSEPKTLDDLDSVQTRLSAGLIRLRKRCLNWFRELNGCQRVKFSFSDRTQLVLWSPSFEWSCTVGMQEFDARSRGH